ncbi:MAG: 4Fe-4S binding protein [Clostridiales bacterium]|nr:4Fe-4S binding protein [Clostridiales bacterium]
MDNNELKDLKTKGFIKTKGTEYFTIRIVTDVGNMTSEQLMVISRVAKDYGRGYVGFTTRLGVEIPWIQYDDIPNVRKSLIDADITIGGTGTKVRAVVACKGTVCLHGIIDTQKRGRQLHKEYFGDITPSKFKIGVIGCPNNCAKAQLHDLGFMGQIVPEYIPDNCTGCELCIDECRVDAISMQGDIIAIDRELCVNCGKCIPACHFGALEERDKGVAVFVGGKFGRQHRIGYRLGKIYSDEEMVDLTGRMIDFYREHGEGKERFGDMIERIGIDVFEEGIKK